MSRLFSGIIPPLITPLSNRDRIDYAGLERLVVHVLCGGVNGHFVLGTTGEGPSLSYRLRRELIERVCRLVQERVPVFVGFTDTSFIESVDLAQTAVASGAAGVVLAAPYYFPVGQTELAGYVRICDGGMTEPFQRFLPVERERVRQCLVEFDLPELQALSAA